jgi:hypothetical protein
VVMDFCIMTLLLLTVPCAEISQLKYTTIPSVHPTYILAWLLPKLKLLHKNRFSKDQRQITDYTCTVEVSGFPQVSKNGRFHGLTVSVCDSTPLKKTA